jgi:putative addiction module component (TIGR02574 family)
MASTPERSRAARSADRARYDNSEGTCFAALVDGRASGNYLRGMSTRELTAEAMALPLPERVSLAQALWENIEAGLADTDEDSALNEAVQRDEELASGSATGRTHEEVMQAARRSVGCG